MSTNLYHKWGIAMEYRVSGDTKKNIEIELETNNVYTLYFQLSMIFCRRNQCLSGTSFVHPTIFFIYSLI